MPNNSKPYKKPFHSNRQHPAAKPESKIDEFSLFTGGKLPELAIAFNLAYDNTEKYIETLQNIKDPLKHIDELNDKVFAYLRHYMWKGNEDNKNTSGYELDKGDKTIIKMLLRKLVELRNFHSHVWHTNDMMQFDKPLVHFIEDKHDAACAKLLEEKKDADATLYYKQLDKFPLFIKGQYISQDGRFFLLSFFLNRGEMQGILQQRKGSKRNDTPEYRFKHKVFTYYCHREGASWDNTGINNDDLQQKDDAEQQRVLSGRNAFAIFNYLKDVPAAMREEAVPLILSSGKWVEDMYGLLLFINEKNILPGFVFEKKIEKASEKEAGNEKDLNEAAKALENKEREGYRHFMLPGNNAYEFEISYPVLRHIVTDIFLDDNDTSPDSNKSREHFKGVLKDCIDTRRYIYDKLKSQGNLPLCHETYRLEKKYSSIYINYSEHEGSMQEIYYTGDEWRNIPISATPKTEKLLIEWHNAFIKGTKEKPEKNEVIKRKKLLNKIRPLGTLFDKSIYEGELKNGRKKIIPGTDPDPLLFHLAYYYREQDTKKRRDDRFVEWGVQHLMHAGLVPGWYFETEQLEYGQKPDEPASPYKLKSATVWQKNIPQNFRLRITENQLNAGIERNGKIYRLRIGEKLLKYLLYWHFREKNKGNKSINGFLEAVTGELALIYNSKNKIDVGSLQLLEAFALPPLLFKTKIEEPDEKGKKATGYREQALAFFTKKQQWLEGLLRNMKKLTRSQKNEALLQAYRLFDFKETQGSKFLRKNEYGQMSVCHYMLNQEKRKVQGLFEKTFKLQHRVPDEIKDILYEVIKTPQEGLDDLFVKIIRNRLLVIKGKAGLLKDNAIKAKKVKDDIVAYFDIYFDDSHIEPNKLEKRTNDRLKTLENLPFDVHPALALKYFYPKQFAMQGFNNAGPNKYENLFYNLRRDARLAGMLAEDTLRENAVLKVLQGYAAQWPGDKTIKQYTGKWIGMVNNIKAKDILLLLVAEEYLNKYDARIAGEFAKLKNLKKIKLDEWFSSEVPVTLEPGKETLKELTGTGKSAIPQKIHFLLRMHQLDDYFFRAQKETLAKLAVFYIQWRQEELERYTNDKTITAQVHAWPDGSSTKPLTYNQFLEARRINAGFAKELVNYIFEYEAAIINRYAGKAGNTHKQKALTDYCLTHSMRNYVEFKTILEWDSETPADVKEEISHLRNSCLHSAIPLNGSYRKMAWPKTPVAEALHIHTPLGKDRTAPNEYDRDTKNEAEK